MHIVKRLYLGVSVVALIAGCGAPSPSSSSVSSESRSSSISASSSASATSSSSESSSSGSSKSSSSKTASSNSSESSSESSKSSSSKATSSSSSKPSSSSQSSTSSSSQTIKVTGVSLNEETLSLVEGDIVNLIATVAPQNATDQSIIWSSSNEYVVPVNATGTAAAIAPGTATITVRTNDGGFTASCQITVAQKESCTYEVGATSCELYEAASTYSTITYIRCCTPIKNTGNVNIYLFTCAYDIYNSSDVLITSFSPYISLKTPGLIAPGETGYFTLNFVYSEAEKNGLIAKPNPVVKNAKDEKLFRYDVSQVSFFQDSQKGLSASGVITNNTNQTTDSYGNVRVILFGANNKYLLTLSASIDPDLQPGESTTFTAAAPFGGSGIAESDIVHYEAYAYSENVVI